VVVTAVKTQQL